MRAGTEIDRLYLFIVAVCALVAIVVIARIALGRLRYHRHHPDAAGAGLHASLGLQLVWTFIPFVLAIAMFAWSIALFFRT